MSNPATSLPPGFRFHPTDEELIVFYLRNRAADVPCPVSIIAEVDIYKSDPWDLPVKANFGDREWYFFSPRDRKYPNGIRPNRAAASGYWKATGTDKPIVTSSGENIGVKKALVFYKGKPPKGIKTNWIMHEYRLSDANSSTCYRPMKLRDSSMRLDDWVLCRIYKKSNTQTVEQQEDSTSVDDGYASSSHTINMNTVDENPNLQRSCSVSDFLVDYPSLVNMFDTPADTDTMAGSLISGNDNNIGLNYQGSDNNNYMKRQRQDEGSSGLMQPPKRRTDTCNLTSMGVNNQFDANQYNLMSQPLFSQQMLLNFHLGLH